MNKRMVGIVLNSIRLNSKKKFEQAKMKIIFLDILDFQDTQMTF